MRTRCLMCNGKTKGARLCVACKPVFKAQAKAEGKTVDEIIRESGLDHAERRKEPKRWENVYSSGSSGYSYHGNHSPDV